MRSAARSAPTWARYLVACFLGITIYFLLPTPALQNLVFVASSVTASVAIAVGVRRHRPAGRSAWLLLAAFPICTAIGNTVWFINDSILHIEPFPSWGDVAFLLGYLLLAAGLHGMLRARTRGRSWVSVLDAAVITTGFAVVSWVYLMAPLLRDVSSTLPARITSVGYPVGNVLVLAIGARLFTGTTAGRGAFRLLGATLVVQLVADTIFAVLNLQQVYGTGDPIDALILTYNVGWGAVALHPRMADLTAAPTAEQELRRPRLLLLAAAGLLPPAALFLNVLRHQNRDLGVLALGAIALFALVILRMSGLVRSLESSLVERHALETELQHRAEHDPLTGLANRALLIAQCQQALSRARRNGTTIALLYIDLDKFKAVNDTLGHAAGDAVLQATASALSAAARLADTVARLGGDEFAVLLGDVGHPQDAREGAVRIHAALVQALSGSGVGASGGLAIASAAEDVEAVLARADAAMYDAKRRCTAGIVEAIEVADAGEPPVTPTEMFSGKDAPRAHTPATSAAPAPGWSTPELPRAHTPATSAAPAPRSSTAESEAVSS